MLSLLVKFAQLRSHLEELQNGNLYCREIKYFKELEDDSIRGDPFEAVIKLGILGPNSEFLIRPKDQPDQPWKKLNIIKGRYQAALPNPLGNLFCMSLIPVEFNEDPTLFKFDEEFEKFGNYFLLVYNQKEFWKRLKKGLRKNKIKGVGKIVDYVDFSTYSGKKTLFQKDASYAWQKEIRLYLDTEADRPFLFSIGDISDISMIYDLNQYKGFVIKKGPL